MSASIWPYLVFLAGFGYCMSVGSRFPHSRFYGAQPRIAAASEDASDLWYKPATYYSVIDQIASSPWPTGGGGAPETGVRPAWAAYLGVVALALVTMLLDVGVLNLATARVMSVGWTVLALAGIAVGFGVYLRTFGPRFSLRLLLAVITVLAALFALALRL